MTKKKQPTKTHEAIEAFFLDLVERNDKEVEGYSRGKPDITVGMKLNGAGRECVTIECVRDYNTIELTFGHLKEVSEFFGTDSINVEPEENSGCETCDYGSSYGFNMEVWL